MVVELVLDISVLFSAPISVPLSHFVGARYLGDFGNASTELIPVCVSMVLVPGT